MTILTVSACLFLVLSFSFDLATDSFFVCDFRFFQFNINTELVFQLGYGNLKVLFAQTA